MMREKLFKALSTLTSRSVRKLDLPSAPEHKDWNKGFAYPHLKSVAETKRLLQSRFIKLGGNKVLVDFCKDAHAPELFA